MFDVRSLIQEPMPGEVFDPPLGFFIFDRRGLQTLEWLVDAIRHESGDVVTLEQLREMSTRGWFPLIEGPWLESGTRGVPLYTPSRVGFVLELQRAGFGEDELADAVLREEWYIDEILTADEWAYEDDDLEVLRLFARSEAQRLTLELQRPDALRMRPAAEARAELDRHEGFLSRMEGVAFGELSLGQRNTFSMAGSRRTTGAANVPPLS